jgi:hypothetical protein
VSRAAISTLQQAANYARAAYAACVQYRAAYGTGADLEVAAELYNDVSAEALGPQSDPADALIQFRDHMLVDADDYVNQYRARHGIPAPGASGGGPGYVTGGAAGSGPVAVAAGFGGWIAAIIAGAALYVFRGGRGKRAR